MPGYVIHLAVAKRYAEENHIKESDEFIKGVIAPDLLKKKGINSHYGKSSNINFRDFFKNHKIDSDYEKGFCLHLVTDYLFYNRFLAKWTPDIYKDYGILNKSLMDKYELTLPQEIKETNVVDFVEGKLSVLSLEETISFIEDTCKINLNKFKDEKVKEEDLELV